MPVWLPPEFPASRTDTFSRRSVGCRTGSRGGKPVKAIAACDVVAGDLALVAIATEPDARCVAVEAFDPHRLDLEEDRPSIRHPRLEQVLDHLMLRVDGDRAPS